ncbi:MAG TPA: AMP-binding protein [Candidatus Acidoferrales bacterium]|nr:AMP-binding protein [Candidatus Acidoferrales bacterium]
MVSSARQINAEADQERILSLVRELVAELGHESGVRSTGVHSHLDRDLGLGSLERVELLVRLEKTFGTRLSEDVVAGAEIVQDLIDAVSTANGEPVNARLQDQNVSRAARTSFSGQAEGLPTAQTFEEVIRHRGRVDAAQTHLIFYEDEGESPTLTFGELLAGAERVAADLARRGIGRGDTVALMLPTSRDFFLSFAGTLLAGAIPVPIYPPFRADRISEYAERQSAILANAGARLLVTFREAASAAKLLKPLVPSIESVVTADTLVRSDAAIPLGTLLHSRANDLALLQYTSGSTGNPKGVMLTHANLLANVRSIGEALGMRNEDVGVSWLPLYHDMGLIGAWLMPLYFGLPVVVMSPLAFLSRPARWLRAFHRFRGTIGAAPNFAYELAAAKISDEDIQGVDLSPWRAALNGAESVLPATLNRFVARFAAYGFRRETLLPVYGLAEASLAVTIPQVGRGPLVDRLDRTAFAQGGRAISVAPEIPAEDLNVISFVSVGPPVPRHEVRIVNDRGENLPERTEGQLWFRGPSSTQGYYRNEAATAALLPEGLAAGWVNSGDRAYCADGEIYITGRVKDIIIHAGHNLYPHEIEDCVARVPGVRKGCVVAFGATDPVAGTERLVIVAESRERNRSLREQLVQAITAQVMETLGQPPDKVEVVPPNAIPKTSSGKLRRDATKQRFLSGKLYSGARPVWLQVAWLAAASSVVRIRGGVTRAREFIYGFYAIAMFALLLLPAWLYVLISPSRKSSARVTTAALRAYLKVAGWQVHVEGREHLQHAKPRMFVANHTSFADIVVLMAALGTDYHFVAKTEVMSMPFFGTFLRKLGHYSFHREDPRARLEQAKQVEEALHQGESVFIFPEGTFNAQSGVRAFHLGAFKAATAAQREIVPIALDGTRRVLRDGTWLPRPGKISITICPPVIPPPSTEDWQQIVQMRDSIRETIATFAHEPLL